MQQLRIGFSEINYRIERSSRRRTVCITVHPQNGVVVKAPPWADEQEIELFVRQKASWITRHLTVFSALPQAAPPERPLADGARLSLLGRELILDRRESVAAGQLRRSRVSLLEDSCPETAHSFTSAGESSGITSNSDGSNAQRLLLELRLLPGDDSDALARAAMERWYRQQARRLLYPRLAFFAAQLGLPAPALFIREQQRRWGSCNSRGEIRLNWRIMLGPAEVADYLCAHEVCHLRQMNHSARFWRLVGKLVPDYKELRQKLKLEGHLYSL